MGCLALLEGVAGGEGQALDYFAFFVGEFRP